MEKGITEERRLTIVYIGRWRPASTFLSICAGIAYEDPETKVIDGTLGKIRYLIEVLMKKHLLSGDITGSVSLYASDSTHGTLHRMEQLLNYYTPEI